MLKKLRKAIEQMDIWSERKIQMEFQQETNRIEHSDDTPKEEKCNLDELLSRTDQLLAKASMQREMQLALDPEDMNELFARLDARIAELEAEEAAFGEKSNRALCENKEIPDNALTPKQVKTTSQLGWVQNYMPRPGFSEKYICKFAEVLVKYFVEDPDNPVSAPLFLSLPDSRISYLLLDLRILVHYIAKKHKEISDKIRQIKKRISNAMASIVKAQEHELDDQFVLAFYLDVLFLLLSIQEYTADRSAKENRAEARRYLSYYLATGLYLANPKSAKGLSYAKEGIVLSDPADRQDAFNILGLCALRSRGGKQLSYDTYLSWITKEPLGLLTELWPKEFIFGSHEDIWRAKEGNEDSVTTMYNNFAYVCDSIAQTYELRSPERKRFQKIAINNLVKALEMNADPIIYRMYGQILADMNTPDKSSQPSLAQFKKALEQSDKLHTRLPAMSLYCDAMIDDLLAMLISSKQDFRQWVNQNVLQNYENLQKCFQDYREMLSCAQEDPLVDEADKRNVWKAFFEVQATLQVSNDKALELALLLIYQLTWNLKKFLRRYAYSSVNYYTRDKRRDAKVSEHRDPGRPIAYYTTIKTALYLFNVLYRLNRDTAPVPVNPGDIGYEQGINCLTMMQAYYMNDPYEGLSFERGISGDDPSKNILFYQGNAWRFREDIFQKNFVFLKSFTDRMDNLLMWNRYGSDRENGSRDSNGCCIRFDPEFFDRVNDTVDSSRNLLVDKDDDYSLYRVVYLNQQGEIESVKNPGLDSNAKRCYGLMKQLLRYINSELCGFAGQKLDDPRISAVRSFVQMALNPVIFLFKDDEYADEQEYRLVVSRSHEELDNIHILPGEPEKVCVNPYFQVCIDKVILGPNVKKPEHWFNHFRYHIACMWRRALGPGAEIPGFTVEKSKIHYHT